jgi:hypothetical protein
MGVDTKGFVLTADKDVFRITKLITRTLDHLIVEEKHLHYPDRVRFMSEEARKAFKTCNVELSAEMEMLSVNFTFRGETRSLKVFFTCDCDHTDYGPQSISMSFGCWGLSGLFVNSVLHALSLIGEPYFDMNDCDDIDPAPLQEAAVTVFGAIKLGYVRDCHLEDWVKDFDAGVVGQGMQFETFFGAPEDTVRDFVAIKDFTPRCDAIKAFAESVPDYPRFLSDYHQECAGT